LAEIQETFIVDVMNSSKEIFLDLMTRLSSFSVADLLGVDYDYCLHSNSFLHGTPHPTATTPFNAHEYIRIYMGCLASKSTVTPKYKYTRKSQGLEEEQWVEVNARKQLLPGLLERVRPAFQSMLDEGKSYKDMFLAFDEDGE